MIENIGRPWFVESPGLGLKLHPCSAPQFLAADAALQLKREYRINFADITKIEVGIPPMRYQRHYHPEVTTGLRGKFAINYVVALCFLDGKLDIETFTDKRANEAVVQAALKKVNVTRDESIPEPGPYCPVAVELKNGTRYEHTARVAKGDPRNPMTREEVLQKFQSNAKSILPESRATTLIDEATRLEGLQNVRKLAGLMGA
jgi:2-methylcitrate dehydratase PrpD